MTGLRIGRDRVRLYGIGLALIGLTQMRFVASVGHYWDWVDFYIAGAMAGTRALLDPTAHAAWGNAHGLPVTAFAYMPGFAWFLAPAAYLSIPWGFAVNAILMACFAIVASTLAVRIYRLDAADSLYMTIGWAPVIAAMVTGQNSPLGLLLSLVAIDGLASDDAWTAGLGVGALWYKPTYGLPFAILLLVYRKWKAIGVLAACGVLWYALSATASGGDWLWPRAYLQSLGGYFGPDFAYNRFKSVSVPGLLMIAGVSAGAAFGLGIAGLVAALAWLRFRKAELLLAGSLAGGIGIALSGHAWAYDAAMMLPALWWVAANGEEPGKTRGIVLAYAIAPFWMASQTLKFDPLAVIVVGGMGWLLATASRGEGTAKLTKGEANKERD